MYPVTIAERGNSPGQVSALIEEGTVNGISLWHSLYDCYMMLYALQEVIDKHDTDDYNGGGEVDWGEALVRLELVARVGADGASKVVNEVHRGEDDSEVEEDWLGHFLDG